jgi:hypothetical protein
MHDSSTFSDPLTHVAPSKSYSYDAIHNAIAKSRSSLQPGGYSRVRGVLVRSEK